MRDTAVSLGLPPLQVPLSDQVIDTLTRLQEGPIILRTVIVCVLIGIVLVYLDNQLKLLDLIGN